MIRRSIGAALSALFLVAVSAPPIAAQTPQPAKKEAPAAAKPAKKPSAKQQAQQQKMKDCSAKWNEHKKTAKEKGRTAHQKFMGDCLKG